MSECENSCVIHVSNCKRILFKQCWICNHWMHSDTDLITTFLSDLRLPHSFLMPCSIILQQLLSCPHRIHITCRMFTTISANGKLLTLVFSRHWRHQEQTKLLDHTTYSSTWFCELKEVETFSLLSLFWRLHVNHELFNYIHDSLKIKKM